MRGGVRGGGKRRANGLRADGWDKKAERRGRDGYFGFLECMIMRAVGYLAQQLFDKGALSAAHVERAKGESVCVCV